MEIYENQNKFLIRLRILSKDEKTRSITFSGCKSLDECIKEIHSIFSNFTLPSKDRKNMEFRVFENGVNGKTKSFNIYDISMDQIELLIKNNIK